MDTQAQKDAVYYWNWCILQHLQAMGLLSAPEVENVRVMNQAHYNSKLIVS